MTKRTHIHRPRQQTDAEAAKERATRERFQREKPTLEELAASGEYSGPMPLGEYWDIWRTMEKLKSLRVSSGLSLADMTAQTGIDRAALSRLENGVAVNPTINTLSRYAAALGKQLVVTIVDEDQTDGIESIAKVVRESSRAAVAADRPTTAKRSRKGD